MTVEIKRREAWRLGMGVERIKKLKYLIVFPSIRHNLS
jgi:hypothetical protein